ncbi:MAG: DUF3883 domain-containing protein [Firmicutes bacterium]|nr:DUF3883 domain-containing protein [Bacillota bacterium]
MKFKNVDLASLENLYYICEKSSQKELEFIRYLYNNDFSNFDENLDVCKKLELLTEKEGKLIHTPANKDFKTLVISKLIEKKYSLGSLNSLLDKFKFDRIEYVFYPSHQEKIIHKWERFFLNDIGLISINENKLIFNDNFLNLLPNKKISLKDLKEKNKRKEELGEKAEQFVLEYELKQSKFFPFLPKNVIQQVSIDFANAGYDIESFDKEVAKCNIYEKIFIEVKCVNKEYQFFWSKNAINKAEELRKKYFLYLVPSNFCEKKLKIIQDPSTNILQNKAWTYETELLSIKEAHNV